METLCRVCLTESRTLTHLSAPIPDYATENYVLTARKVLEMVTFTSIEFNVEKYPHSICQMCLSMLKFAYEFQLQFNKSQKVLNTASKKQEDLIKKKKKSTLKKPLTRLVQDPFNNLVIIEEDSLENVTSNPITENVDKTIVIVVKREAVVDEIQEGGLNDDNESTFTAENNTTNEDSYIGQFNIANGDETVPVTPAAIFRKDDCGLNGVIILQEHNDAIDYDGGTVSNLAKCKDEISAEVNDNNAMSGVVIIEELDMNDYYQSTNCAPKAVDFLELHQCKICNSVYGSRKKLTRHVRRHRASKIRTGQLCPKCGFLGKSSSAAQYRQFKHSEKDYQCQLCNKTYNTLYSWFEYAS